MYLGKWLYVLVILVLVSSCGGGGGGNPSPSTDVTAPPSKAVIINFTASNSSVVVGTSVTLTTEFSGGTGSIDNGVGNVIPSSQITVTPAVTTTYILTVTDDEGAVTTADLTINVTPLPEGSPTITSFTATKNSVLTGASTGLTAVFTDGTGSIDNSIGNVVSNSQIIVKPVVTTTYILTVTNDEGVTTVASVTIKVTPVPDLPTISEFSAAKSSINAGESVELTAIFNGGTGSIDNGVGGVISATSVTVTPSETTTYILTVDITIEDLFSAKVTEQVTIQVINQTLTSVHYFSANDGVNGAELWKTTGTAATTEMVLDINSGSASSRPRGFFKFNNAVYFKADGGTGVEVWKTTDSPPGAVRITNFNNGANALFGGSSSLLGPNRMVIYNNKLFFAADDGVTGSELWSIDTSDVVTLEANIGDNSTGSRPTWLTVYRNKLYFSASAVLGNREFWSFDANTDAASLVKDIFPGTDNQFGSQQSSSPSELTAFEDTLYFSASFAPSSLFTDTELFQSKGSRNSTTLFFEFTPFSINSRNKRASVKDLDVTSRGMFLWASTNFSYELYILEANSNSPRKVKNIYSAATSEDLHLPDSNRGVFMNNTYYFPQYDGNTVQIWRTDGSAAGTAQVTTVDNIPGGIARVGFFFDGPEMVADNAGRYLYFGTLNKGLWVLDSTDDSFQLLMDANTPNNSQVSGLNMVDDTVYFSATDGTNGKELWRSEDTPSSAVMVEDINAGNFDSQP